MTRRVEILFGGGVDADSVFILNEDSLDDELAVLGPGSGEWVDVTDDLLLPLATNRGRTRSVDTFRAGSGTLILDNSTGRYDPTDDTGPFHGELVPRRRIRISVNVDGDDRRIIVGWVDDWIPTYLIPRRCGCAADEARVQAAVDWDAAVDEASSIADLKALLKGDGLPARAEIRPKGPPQ